MQQHSVWDEALCLVGHCYPGGPWLLGSPFLAQLEINKWQIDLLRGCTNQPVVADVNLSYAAKSPNFTRGVIYNLNDIVDRGCNVYGSASLLALPV